jgi:2-oxoglutarate dehydrogenase E1 component
MVQKLEETSFLAGANAAFIEALYEDYLRDPQSVDKSWNRFFSDLGANDLQSLQQSLQARQPVWESQPLQKKTSGSQELSNILDAIRALQLIRAYRVRGHLKARLDPLKLTAPAHYAELEPSYYGFTEQDYDRPICYQWNVGIAVGYSERNSCMSRKILLWLDWY